MALGYTTSVRSALALLVLSLPLLGASCLSSSDDAFRRRADIVNARTALEGYEKCQANEPLSTEAAWKFSMASYFFGHNFVTEQEEKKSHFRRGRDIGLAAVERDAKCAPCQFWTAVNMALYGESVGVFRMLGTIPAVKRLLLQSMENDPSYAYGGALRILGMIYNRLPGILGGDDDKAREYFRKAIEIAPDEPLNYWAMVKLLEEEFGDRAGALGFAEKALLLPSAGTERVESREARAELDRYVRDRKAGSTANEAG